eukprot:snap_masked-scaffold_15-processed-gene-7.12-mRNA-1 protein AED:1.00 eAED:1.00 QI:0/-1/0/0/-1/1/1/0/91
MGIGTPNQGYDTKCTILKRAGVNQTRTQSHKNYLKVGVQLVRIATISKKEARTPTLEHRRRILRRNSCGCFVNFMPLTFSPCKFVRPLAIN